MTAIEKINGEMQKQPDSVYLEIVGHYLIDRAGAEPAVAAAIMAEGRSLGKAWGAVSAMAGKKKKGNVAVLTPTEVFAEVDKHFGIPPNPAAWMAALVDCGYAEQSHEVAGATSASGVGANPQAPSATPGKGKVLSLDDFF